MHGLQYLYDSRSTSDPHSYRCMSALLLEVGSDRVGVYKTGSPHLELDDMIVTSDVSSAMLM